MAMSSIYQHPTRQNDSFAALLGARIRELRLRVGLTQAELGSPRTRSFISAVEHGRTLPSLRALLQMAERLGVPVAVLLDELEAALDELPGEQREVFVAHALEGRSFKELSAESGVNVNTLLSRKRYAVLHLRRRLQSTHDEFTRK